MITFKNPMVVTPEDRKRAEAVAKAEAAREKVTPIPAFMADGLGACRKSPTPDDFTEDGTRERASTDKRNRARGYCYRCPFEAECFEYAKAERLSGIFAGEWLVAGRIRQEPKRGQ